MGEVDPMGVWEVNIIEVFPTMLIFGKKLKYGKIPISALYTTITAILGRF